MIRLIGSAMLAVLVTACFPIVRQVSEPSQSEGVKVAFEVTNRSIGEVQIGYDYISAMSSGGGNGSVAGCERTVMEFGPVAGTFQILVDGDQVGQADVPEFVVREGFLVVPLEIADDGTVSIGAMRGVEAFAAPANQVIPGCR
ncbi:MAG: hypothetical protein ABIW50_04675 [Candidatus Limnocylindria bacterium]